MDFKIEDDSGKTSKKKLDDKVIWIIVFLVAFICGLVVFLVVNAFYNKPEKDAKPLTEQSLPLTEENVRILYQYVTYGTRNKRNDKFLKEEMVTGSTFNNQEKFYYALQFAKKSDFTDTGEKNSKGEKIYHISEAKIREYMQRFFGDISYSSKVSFSYPFRFVVNNKNVGLISTAANDGYDVVFNAIEGNLPNDLVEPYYTKLVAAYKEIDGTYRLEEKVVYTRLEKSDNIYNIYLYKDYAQTKLIGTLTDLTEASLKQNPIIIDDYIDKAATITYHFDLYNSMLCFDSSKISYE